MVVVESPRLLLSWTEIGLRLLGVLECARCSLTLLGTLHKRSTSGRFPNPTPQMVKLVLCGVMKVDGSECGGSGRNDPKVVVDDLRSLLNRTKVGLDLLGVLGVCRGMP